MPDEAARLAKILAHDEALRLRRALPSVPTRPVAAAAGPAWVVHTAGNGRDLPGEAVRRAG